VDPDRDETDEADDVPATEPPPHPAGDVPEADALEQAQPVGDERRVLPPPGRGEVPEADWLEQSVAEPLDDDER